GNDITDSDLSTYGAYAGFKFTPDIELKGIYYWQDQGRTRPTHVANEDSANAWKAILQVNQNALKFTSLWLEYGQIDNNFEKGPAGLPGSRAGTTYAINGAEILWNRPSNSLDTTTVIAVFARQQWSDKWRTYERFIQADFDTASLDDATNWTFGVAYRLSPAIEFDLSYDNIDYGDNNPAGFRTGDDHQIRFRTFVTF
ncbi:MAG: S-layer homology domain-containing protein, partial [Synergistaceae bacterium]|nr:S-layer homology domain-containing protein [Synergistaceae bacterium]